MTMPEHEYRRLLRRTLIATALCIAAVLVCYFWIDRPVAFFVYRHHINEFQVFRWLTYPPPEVQTWSPLVLTAIMLRRAWGPFVHWQKVLLVACLSLIVADQFRIALGDICGRYWPDTWTHDNPSLIGTGNVRFPSVSAWRRYRQLSIWARLQNPRVRHGVDDCDSPQSSRRHDSLCSDAREPCGNELSFCQRRDRWRHFRRDHRHIRGAFGPAPHALRESRFAPRATCVNNLREATIYRSVLASFCAEAFGLERLRNLSMEEIQQRYEIFKTMSQFELPE